MSQNYPGPFELDFVLRVDGLTHRVRLNVIALNNPVVGTPMTQIQLLMRSGNPTSAAAFISEFWGWLRALYSPSSVLNNVILWRYASNSFQKTFISETPVTPNAGSGAATYAAAGQATFTFRSGLGGIAKVVVIEHAGNLSNDQFAYSTTSSAPAQRLMQFLVSANSCAIARDNAFLVTGIRVSYGQNEAIWRRRFRRN